MPILPNPKVTQVPGGLDIEMVRGDDLNFMATFNTNLTDYSYEAVVVLDNKTEIEFELTVIDLVTGILNFYMPNSKSVDFPVGEMTWYFSWTTPEPASLIRKILAGKFTVLEGG